MRDSELLLKGAYPSKMSLMRSYAESTEELRNQALVHARGAFVLAHLDEAVDGGLVEALLCRLVGVKHHAPADRVERVVERRGDGARNGRADEGRHNADHALVRLVRVHVLDLREEAELAATVDESTSHRDGRPTVETRDATCLHGLHDAICDSVELSLALAKVRGKARARKVERIAHNVGQTTSQSAGQELHAEVLVVVSLRVVLRNHALDLVVERQRRALLRSVADAIHEVAAPECPHTLLGGHTLEAIPDARVLRDLARNHLGVRVLRLEQQLHTLHWRHGGLHNGPAHSTEGHVQHEATLSLAHLVCELLSA